MKASNFWLVAQLITGLAIPVLPVQAETVNESEKFSAVTIDSLLAESELPLSAATANLNLAFEDNPFANELALSESSTDANLSFTDLVKPDNQLDANPIAADQPLVPNSLIQELSALSTHTSLNFAQPSPEDLVAQSALPAPPPPAGDGQQPLFPNPEIIIQQSSPQNPDILTPRVPVAPSRARAVPPPVGDIAISNINAAYDLIDLGSGGRAIVPRLVLRKAPAREVLAVLTRYAGMNLIFTDGKRADGGAPGAGDAPAASSNFSLDIENESVQDVFNAVLMASGLQASRRGNTIFAGESLLPSARNTITRTVRLNQASADSVASVLASQGAEVNILFEGQEEVQLAENAPPRVIKQPPTLVPLTVNRPSSDTSVLILEGLVVSTDDRLNTLTLVGEPRSVELATSMITQMDARRRQVAVNVKIVDVNLNNIQDYNSSFSFGINDSYFVQDNGTTIMRFGDTAPVGTTIINSKTGRVTNPPVFTNPFSGEINTLLNINEFTFVPGRDISQLDTNVFPLFPELVQIPFLLLLKHLHLRP